MAVAVKSRSFEDAPGLRTSKRQKLTNGSHAPTTTSNGASRVFAPFRTIGLVSPTTVPFVSVPLGKTTFQITTSVGRSLQTYDLRRGLNLVFVSRPQTPEIITASAVWKDKAIAAWGGDSETAQRGVWVFKRGKKEQELSLPAQWSENIHAFCIFGSWIVGVCETSLVVWKNTTYELYTTLHGISPVKLTTCIASLPTFLNKIIVGRQDGSAEIWNVSSGKLVYTILPPSTAYGAVTAIEPTPALSLVAIAFAHGHLSVHDIQADQPVIQLQVNAATPVTSISFRTDGLGAGSDGKLAGVMATASVASSDVTLWDLNDGGRKAGVLRAAHAQPTDSHPGGTGKVEFLAGQAILVSGGLDNSLKTWIFDEVPFNPVPRILHQRAGHGAPVSRLLFLPTASDGSDDTGKWLLASSRDRSLWGWSLRRDGQSTELSQGSVQKKAKKQGLLSGNRDALDALKCPPITAIACSLNRDGGMGAIPGKQPIWQQGTLGKKVSAEVSAMTGWESVLTAHENDSKARTWFWGRKRAGRWALQTSDEGNVSSIALSPCGTFGLIGSEKGGIDMYNLQSGQHRQRFPARLTPLQAKQLRLDIAKLEEDGRDKKFFRGQGRHTAPVIGLAVDSLNKTVISASADGKLKFWDFTSGLLTHQINWSATTSFTAMRFHRPSALAAVSCVDGCIRVIDTSTSKLVRELRPSRNPIAELQLLQFTDFTFSQDGRFLAACMGPFVLLWDLPTGHLIDAFKLRADCTALAFSPTGEYLATATTDSVGVDLWTNRTLFMHVSTRHISEQELRQLLQSTPTHEPTVSGEGANNLLLEAEHAASEDDDAGGIPDGLDASLDRISSDLLSLSLVPRSRWQNLLYMDLVRQRNKPAEPPKKPEKAPFFLPSLQTGSDAKADSASTAAEKQAADAAALETERSRIMRLAGSGETSIFTRLLRTTVSSADQDSTFPPFLAHLRSLNPAAADIEIRSLNSFAGTLNGDEDGPSELVAFVEALTWQLRQRRDFELVQAWMAVFLKVHGDVVLEDDALSDALEVWRTVLREERRRVEKLVGYCGGMIGYLRAARV